MALNWATFRTRALTAIVFVVVMLAGLLWSHWSFFILFSIIHFGCWWEYLKLLEKIHSTEYHINVKLGLMIMGYGVMLYLPVLSDQLLYDISRTYSLRIGGGYINLNFLVIAVGTLLTFAGTIQQQRLSLKAFGFAALGLLYISVSWGMMLQLRDHWSGFENENGSTDFGYTLPLFIIVAIWLNDTSAYIVGSLIGKTPLSKISPKKTWEGTIGGILLAALLTGLLFTWFDKEGWVYIGINNNKLFILPVIIAVAGTFGDLLESKLKRMAGVKDSGSIMPGHGGFLDRFDSLLLAIPAVWFWFSFLE
jgi:phosphatidate cytidylyltransferase